MTRTILATLALVLVTSTSTLADREPGIWTARAAIGELGFSASDDAYAAIAEVHVRRARLRGWSTSRVAKAYSSAIRRPRRAWVPELHGDASRPPRSWPSLPWAPRARRFNDVLAVVQAVLRGERDEVCPDALHYGSVADGPPGGDREGWVEACAFESTSQRFWKRR